MNIHHLELFYYVARHGGISKALRHIPYGIQQPAVSGQMIQLEEDLGVRLFERTPFCLTASGKELYAFAEPFFNKLDDVEQRLREQSAPVLRIGAAESFLCDHLPPIMSAVRARVPGLRLDLRSSYEPQHLAWVMDREIDVAVTPLEGKAPLRIKQLKLAELPLVLVCPKDSPYKTCRDLWALKRIADPLICLPPEETLSRLFQKGLKSWRVLWQPSIIASSLSTLHTYVCNGYGIGVSVLTPELIALQGRLKILPLDGFDKLSLVALWQGTPAPALKAFLEEASKASAEFSKG